MCECKLLLFAYLIHLLSILCVEAVKVIKDGRIETRIPLYSNSILRFTTILC